MKKTLFMVSLFLFFGSVLSVSAAPDPNASVGASFSGTVSPCCTKGVTGAISSNANLDYINNFGQLFDENGTLVSQGVVSAEYGETARWVSSGLVAWNAWGSKVKATARSYYVDGTSSDQIFASRILE